MRNLYKILAWIFTATGGVMLFFSIIAFLAGGQVFRIYWNTYYWTVSTLLMFAVVFLLFHLAACKEKKE